MRCLVRSAHFLVILFPSLLLSGCFINSGIQSLDSGASLSVGEKPNSPYDFPLSLTSNEGSTIDVVFKLNSALDPGTEISYDIVNDTAVAGINYIYSQGRIKLSPNQKEFTVSVNTLDILMPEAQVKKFKLIWKKSLSAKVGEEVLGSTEVTLKGNPDIRFLDNLDLTFSKPAVLLDKGNYFLFTKRSFLYGTELWRSDGTTVGSVKLGSFCNTACNASVITIADVSGVAFIAIQTGQFSQTSQEIWKTDGTVAGTQKVFSGTDLGIKEGVPTPSAYKIYPFYTVDTFNSDLFKPLNNKVVFLGFGTTGTAIWISDGTLAGTTRLSYVADSNFAPYLAVTANYVFFKFGNNLWSTDGTVAGTGRLYAQQVGFGGYTSPISTSGNYAFATFDGGAMFSDSYAMRSDGTVGGTVVMNNAKSTDGFYFPTPPFVSNNGVYYWKKPVSFGSTTTEVWVVPNTGNTGTLVYSANAYQGIQFLGSVGNTTLFTVNQNGQPIGIYLTDGTLAGTVKVVDLPYNGFFYSIKLVASGNGKLLFSASENNASYDARYPTLWISDGTIPGTTLASSFFTAKGLSQISPIRQKNGQLLFTAVHPSFGRELWTTDLTLNGTNLFQDHTAGTAGSNLTYLFDAVNSVWFSEALSGLTNGAMVRLNQTTGSPATTNASDFSFRSPFTFNNGASQGTPNWVIDDNAAYFTSQQGNQPRGLFKFKVSDLAPQRITTVSESASLVGASGHKIWYYDNKVLSVFDSVSQISLDLGSVSGSGFFPVNSTFLFYGSDSASGYEPWVSDGTVAGTHILADLTPGTGSSFGMQIFTDKNFSTSIGFISTSTTLYTTDGVSLSTLASSFNATPSGFAVMGGKVYFIASTAASGQELWVTDGTIGGTGMVSDLQPGAVGGSSMPVAVGNKIIFMVDRSGGGRELWATDGITTTMLKTLTPTIGSFSFGQVVLNSKMYFSFFNGVNATEFWVSDGSVAGTVSLATQLAAMSSSLEYNPVIFKDKVYFWSGVDTGGGLYKPSILNQTDGTAVGTKAVANIQPSYYSPSSQYMLSTDRYIYFSTYNPQKSTDFAWLWRSDGAVGGVTKEIPGNTGYNPKNLKAFGNFLLFTQQTDSQEAVISISK